MEYLESILLGLLQGITEFLPVSSSGHLYLLQTWRGLEPSTALEILLHVGSLLAVVIFFWKEIIRIVREMFTRGGDSLGWKLAVATIFTAPTGVLVHNFFTEELSLQLVGTTLLITAALIIASEFFRPKKSRELTWTIAIFLGLAQGLAVLPGLSRSGLTIVFLILIGLPRKQAAEVSFLLAIPTIVGALVFSVGDASTDLSIFAQPETWVGFAFSAIAAVAAIAWMMKIIEGKWIYFAPYCALLGAYLIF